MEPGDAVAFHFRALHVVTPAKPAAGRFPCERMIGTRSRSHFADGVDGVCSWPSRDAA